MGMYLEKVIFSIMYRCFTTDTIRLITILIIFKAERF